MVFGLKCKAFSMELLGLGLKMYFFSHSVYFLVSREVLIEHAGFVSESV